MSEEHKAFPGGDAIIEETEEDLLDEEVPQPSKVVPPVIVPVDIPVVIEEHVEEGFADFSQMGESSSSVPENVYREAGSEVSPPPSVDGVVSDEKEAPLSTSQAPEAPPSKTSLDIEDRESRFLRGESGESQSPVTPEELELHNLAKLESLKESDA